MSLTLVYLPRLVAAAIPLWLLEVFRVVHCYEAILAVLSILVWHFYHVLWNPDEAPMALSSITGRVTRDALERSHPEDCESGAGGEPPPSGAT